MNLKDLIDQYGDEWTIRTWPQPGATRRQHLDQATATGRLANTLWAPDLPTLAALLAEQEKLVAEFTGQETR